MLSLKVIRKLTTEKEREVERHRVRERNEEKKFW